MRLAVGSRSIVLKEGDLTLEDVDAIVNAANGSLLGGGGVDGAIHRRGGPAILEECRKIRAELGTLLPPGRAVITGGGELKARRVIHVVGPVFDSDPEPDRLLADAHWNSLELARREGLRSLAFPAISTGAYGFPIDRAAPIALGTVRRHILETESSIVEVRFVLFGRTAYDVFARALQSVGAD